MGWYSVSTTVQDISELLMWHQRARDISIDIDDSIQEGRKLNFDLRALQVVLYNVLQNALKFSKKGRISIGVKERRIVSQRDCVLIEVIVHDRGIGIYEHEMSQVFNLLWRSKSVANLKLNPDGQGIGLYISKQLCQSLGGDVDLMSVYNQGCYVTITMRAYPNVSVAQEMTLSS